MNKRQAGIVLALSLIISALIITAGSTGLSSAGLYAKETFNWQVQTQGQDLINIFLIAPFLFISAVMIFRKIRQGLLLWTGCLLYVIYTYLIYCFDIHFNNFFIEYCLILGISFYLCIFSFYVLVKEPYTDAPKPRLNKFTGVYFLIVALLFAFLWLSEIVPAIAGNAIPKTLSDAGLFTNPVEVIDLSVFLPGVFISGILLLKRNKFASSMLAPVILTFFILMDITIAFLTILMVRNGIATNGSVALFMLIMALVSLILLLLHLKARE